MRKRNVIKGADMMGHIENRLEDKEIFYFGFPSNEALIHNDLNKIILSTRLLMHHFSLSSEDKDNNFENGATRTMA